MRTHKIKKLGDKIKKEIHSKRADLIIKDLKEGLSTHEFNFLIQCLRNEMDFITDKH